MSLENLRVPKKNQSWILVKGVKQGVKQQLFDFIKGYCNREKETSVQNTSCVSGNLQQGTEQETVDGELLRGNVRG